MSDCVNNWRWNVRDKSVCMRGQLFYDEIYEIIKKQIYYNELTAFRRIIVSFGD